MNMRPSLLAVLVTVSPGAFAASYLQWSESSAPGHTAIFEFFDESSEALEACTRKAAGFGYPPCSLSGANGRSFAQMGWMCVNGPSGCREANNPGAWVLYTGYACPTGHRYVRSLDKCVPIIDIDRTRKTPPCGSARGNPIYPLNGLKREAINTGVVIGDRELRLVYSNEPLLPRVSGTANFVPVPAQVTRGPGLGPVWTTSFHTRMYVTPVALEQGGASVGRSDGSVVSFAGLTPVDADQKASLLNDWQRGTIRYTDPEEIVEESYSSSGTLRTIEWGSGEQVSFTYSDSSTPANVAPAPGYLLRVTDRQGRTASFKYQLPPGAKPETGGLLSEVTDANNRVISFLFTPVGALTTITWQDLTKTVLLYERADLPLALTGVINESNLRQSTFTYDTAGRAIGTSRGTASKYDVTVATPATVRVSEALRMSPLAILRYHDLEPATGVSVRGPNGIEALGASVVQGKAVITSTTQPPGAGCAAATRATEYDLNGNVVREDNFNGERTCFGYSARNLETFRSEGLTTVVNCATELAQPGLVPGSRVFNTRWHPDWNRPTAVSEPQRRTTIVYNGQLDPDTNTALWCAPSTARFSSTSYGEGKPYPLICKVIVEATIDSNGWRGFAASIDTQARRQVTLFTYDARGQVLTSTSPVSGLTTYQYKPTGELELIRNAKGHTTTFQSFNGRKQVTSLRDANGVLTTLEYDPRGRLLSTIRGLASTRITYTGAQVASVTSGDASWRFSHGFGGLRSSVTDSTGNVLVYGRDANGKVITEQTLDANGTVRTRHTLTRDGLGRVSGSTGDTLSFGEWRLR